MRENETKRGPVTKCAERNKREGEGEEKKRKKKEDNVVRGTGCFKAERAYLVVRKGPAGIAGPRRRLNDYEVL